MICRFFSITIVLIALAVMPGCKKQEPPAATDTAQQVQEEAPPVTEENLDEQVDKMEQEIQEDIAAEE